MSDLVSGPDKKTDKMVFPATKKGGRPDRMPPLPPARPRPLSPRLVFFKGQPYRDRPGRHGLVPPDASAAKKVGTIYLIW